MCSWTALQSLYWSDQYELILNISTVGVGLHCVHLNPLRMLQVEITVNRVKLQVSKSYIRNFLKIIHFVLYSYEIQIKLNIIILYFWYPTIINPFFLCKCTVILWFYWEICCSSTCWWWGDCCTSSVKCSRASVCCWMAPRWVLTTGVSLPTWFRFGKEWTMSRIGWVNLFIVGLTILSWKLAKIGNVLDWGFGCKTNRR